MFSCMKNKSNGGQTEAKKQYYTLAPSAENMRSSPLYNTFCELVNSNLNGHHFFNTQHLHVKFGHNVYKKVLLNFPFMKTVWNWYVCTIVHVYFCAYMKMYSRIHHKVHGPWLQINHILTVPIRVPSQILYFLVVYTFGNIHVDFHTNRHNKTKLCQ